MKARMFIGTLNNPGDDYEGYLEAWTSKGQAAYCTGQLEKGECGTPHL